MKSTDRSVENLGHFLLPMATPSPSAGPLVTEFSSAQNIGKNDSSEQVPIYKLFRLCWKVTCTQYLLSSFNAFRSIIV